jgi:hypothetical protein
MDAVPRLPNLCTRGAWQHFIINPFFFPSSQYVLTVPLRYSCRLSGFRGQVPTPALHAEQGGYLQQHYS